MNLNQKPPSDTHWIIGNKDLPQSYAPARYRVTDADGTPNELTLSKRKRQVLEALMIGPVYCASPVRLSDVVLILRRDHKIDIVTTFYDDDTGPVGTRYGVYSLADHVECVADDFEVAA